LRIIGYTPIVRNSAFAAMTIDDARWMARLIGQLRAEQITQALAASGYEGAARLLHTRKLIGRRNKMMTDLGLSAEFPPLTLVSESVDVHGNPGQHDDRGNEARSRGGSARSGVLQHHLHDHVPRVAATIKLSSPSVGTAP
jgi:hypothetical protein